MSGSKSWICDTCGEVIENPKDGWVEWITFEDSDRVRRYRDLRLVHHRPASPHKEGGGCQFNQRYEFERDGGTVMDYHLPDLLGVDGLMMLLSMVAEEMFPLNEILEIIKRLHILGYEQARMYFDRAISEGIIEPNMFRGYYWQHEIQEVLRRKRELEF